MRATERSNTFALLGWTTVPSRHVSPPASREDGIAPPDDMRVVQGRLTVPAVVIGLLALSPLPLVLPSGVAVATIAALGLLALVARRWIGRHASQALLPARSRSVVVQDHAQ
jgi:hypothetical protein